MMRQFRCALRLGSPGEACLRGKWISFGFHKMALGLSVALISSMALVAMPDGRSTSTPAIKRSSSAISIASDGQLVLAVNPDSNSLSLVDTATQQRATEIAVGVDPRTVAVEDTGQRAYVANRGSDTISVVDLDTRDVVVEVPVGRRPYGVLVSPDGALLYVTEQGVDQVRILDTEGLNTLALLPTYDRPSGLAISDGGRALYVTHLLTNTITVLTIRPFAIYLPLVLKDSRISRQTLRFGPCPPRVTHYDVSHISLWPDSNLMQSIVLSPDGHRAYVSHTRSNSSNPILTFDTTVFPLVSLIDVTTHEHLVGQQIGLGTLDPPGVGLPFDAAVASDGGELWVLNAASNDVSVIDLASYPSYRLAAHIEVGDNPRGIVLSPDGHTAYVNNTLEGTLSVIDTAAYTVTGVITLTGIPLPPALLRGKRLYHTSDDPRLSLAQWISCNTCHFEGEHDGRTWLFGFAGPRNTTSLLGMIETYPLRWSGEWDESADSEFANRKENFGSGLIEGEMNCVPYPPDCVTPPPNQSRSYDLDCLAAFIDSLRVPLSPAHARSESLTEAEVRGQTLFHNPALDCTTCHPPPLYTDQRKHDVGTATPDEKIGPVYDTPTLRGLYDSAPYFHDGSGATLYDALTRPSPGSEHDVSGLLTEAEIQDLAAFLLALPFDE